MAVKNKINWLLILQGWAMFCVVLGHSAPAAKIEDFPSYALIIYYFCYSFHMPLFIAISGFLFYLTRINSNWTYLEMIKEKLVRFGIPFLVFTMVGMVLKSVFASSVDRPTTISLGELVNAILYPGKGPFAEFWFLGTIIWFFVLSPVWKFFLGNKYLAILLLIGLAILSPNHPKTEFLALTHVCKYAIYFFAGILCAMMYKKKASFITSLAIPVLFVAGGVIYAVGRLWHIPLMAPFGGITFSLSLALLCERIYPSLFVSFRNYTYQIYLLGIFFNVMVTIISAKFELPFVPMQILSLLLGLYMPVLISRVLQTLNFKPLLMCVGLKSKVKI